MPSLPPTGEAIQAHNDQGTSDQGVHHRTETCSNAELLILFGNKSEACLALSASFAGPATGAVGWTLTTTSVVSRDKVPDFATDAVVGPVAKVAVVRAAQTSTVAHKLTEETSGAL